MKTHITIFFLLFVAQTAVAQSDTVRDIFSLSLQELMNVEVVSSSKTSERTNEAPNVISAYRREQIINNGWNNLNDILYKMPGFFPSQDYDRRTVGARGIFEGWNNNHLLMLIDGVPCNDNLYGTAFTSEITPLIFTRSVEVIRGPGAALYGSNATNGVVTLNTMQPNDLGMNNGYVSFKIGEKNTRYYDFVSGVDGRNFTLMTSFSFSQTDGEEYDSFDGSGEVDANNKAKKFTTNDNRQNSYFWAKLQGRGKYEGLSLQYHHQEWKFQTGHGWLWNITDINESMHESRDLFIAKYTQKIGKNELEYALRYQLHDISWNMLFFRKGAFDGYYPAGVSEYLNTYTQDVFARVQYKTMFYKKMSLVVGIEPDVFFYNGDKEHYTNTDILDRGGFLLDDGTPVPADSAWFAPFPHGEYRKLDAFLEVGLNHPVFNIGSFAQYSSGELLGSKIRLTAGVRYDNQFLQYNHVLPSVARAEVKSKSFSQISPRVALLMFPTSALTIKFMAGRAFRAPAPSEMFGANTWALASNIEQLEPEIITTTDGMFEYEINNRLSARLNIFYTIFNNQIAYSLGNNNLSTNVYSFSNTGVETELFFGKDALTGFINASFCKRLDEKIFEGEKAYVSLHPKRLTWAPAFTANTGVNYRQKRWSGALLAHYQGKVLRRDLDLYDANALPEGFTELPRPESVAPWVSFDIRTSYRLGMIELGLSATNLLNTPNYLVKNLRYPFDYRMEGRRIMLNAIVVF